jgi:hypothetical protein
MASRQGREGGILEGIKRAAEGPTEDIFDSYGNLFRHEFDSFGHCHSRRNREAEAGFQMYNFSGYVHHELLWLYAY